MILLMAAAPSLASPLVTCQLDRITANSAPPNLRLPFHLPRATSDLPLETQSLKDLTGRLLLARQIARISDFCELWEIEPYDTIPNSFCAKFDGQLIHGLQLFSFEAEENVNNSYRECAFGCIKNGEHQHLYNPE